MHQIWIAIKTTAADMLRNLATPTVRNHASGTDTGGHRHPQQVVRTPHTPRGAGNSAAGEARSPRYRSACHRTRNAMRRLFSHLPFSNRLSPVSIRPSAAQTASLSAQTPDNPSRSSISQPAFLRRWILPLIPILSLLAVTPAFAQGTVTLAVSESGRVTEGGELIITATLDSANMGTATLVIPLSVLGAEAGTTAQAGDYTALSNITIAAGADEGSTSFTVTTDSDDEPAETVVVGIDTNALPSRVKAGDPNQVTITIVDNNLTTVAYGILDDAFIGEVPAAGVRDSNRASFTVELSRELVDGERAAVAIGNISPLGVLLTADVSSDTAGARITTDSPFSAEFPGVVFTDAGAQSATVELTAIDNDSRAPLRTTEFVLLSLVGFFEHMASSNLDGGITLDFVKTGGNPGNLEIVDDEYGLPEINLYVVPGGRSAVTDTVLTVSESNIDALNALSIRVRSRFSWHTDIAVELEVEETGSVFRRIRDLSGLEVVIFEGDGRADFALSGQFRGDNDIDESNRIFSVSAQPSDGYQLAPRSSGSNNISTLGTSDHSVAVTDDDPTTVTLASAAGDVNEGSSKIFTVTLSRGLEDGESLSVPLVLGGTATFGTDYILSCAPATGITCQNPVAASAGSPMVTFTGPDTGTSATVATLTLHALGDGINDANESVRIDLGDPGEGVGIGQSELSELAVDSNAVSIGLGGPVQTVDNLNDFLIGSDADTRSPSLILAPVGGLTIGEGGSAGYTVVLEGTPTASVTVTITGAPADLELSPSTLTFATANWDQPQAVTVTARQDDDTRNDDTVLNHRADGGGDVLMFPFSVTVTDDDIIGITIRQSGGDTAVSETGGTDSYTVALGSRPSSNVTIAVNSNLRINVGGLGNALTFTPSNWNQPQIVTVSIPDDNIDQRGDRRASIDHRSSSTDPDYQEVSQSITVTITGNDDTEGVIIMPNRVMVADDGTTVDTYTVVLNSQPAVLGDPPAGPVPLVSVLATAPAGVTVGDGRTTGNTFELTFVAANWNQPQTVTVTGIRDDVDTGMGTNTLTITHTISGGFYESTVMADAVTVIVQDDDMAGIVVPDSLSITEEGAVPYPVVLASEPSAEVTVTIEGDLGDLRLNGSTLTITLQFTSSNWDQPQIVNVMAAEDGNADDEMGTLRHTASGATEYDEPPVQASITVSVQDNDAAGVSVRPTGFDTAVSEAAGTDSYTVVLLMAPSADVVIGVTSGDASAATVEPDTLTFTTRNWNQPRMVIVTGVDDQIDNLNDRRTVQIDHTISTTDSAYSGATVDSVEVTVNDDDTAGVTVTVATPIIIHEDGRDTGTYTVVLDSQPLAAVSIAITGGTTAAAAPETLEFATSNWNQPQTVTVTGINDRIDNANNERRVDLAHRISGAGDAGRYVNTLGIDSVPVTVEDDNDFRGLVVEPSSATVDGTIASADDGVIDIRMDEGEVTSYTVALSSQPTAAATVSIEISTLRQDGAEPPNTNGFIELVPTQLTFTPVNWDQPQTVQITSLSNQGGANVRFNLVHQTTGAGSDYASTAGVAYPSVVQVNSVPAVSVVAVNAVVTEGEAAVFSISAMPAPASTLTISLSIAEETGSGQSFVASDQLGSMDVEIPPAGTVTLSIPTLNDSSDEASGQITARISNGAGYNLNLSAFEAMVTVNDDDIPTVTITGDGAVNEGDPAVFTVEVSPAPAVELTVSLTVADATSGFLDTSNEGAKELTINAGSTTVSYSIDTVGDNVGESNGTVTVTVNAGSDYQVGDPGAATVVVNNDDTAGLDISEAAVTVDEEGSSTYTVALTSEPTANVTVTITGASDPLTVDTGSTLTFDDTNWSDVQTVTLTAAGDANMDDETFILVHTASGSATEYDSVSEDVPVRINDSTLPEVTIAGGAAVTEGSGDAATFTLTVEPAPSADLTVTVAVAEEAGQDFVDAGTEGAGRSVTIDTSGTAEYTVAITDNDVDESNGTITVTIEAGSDYTVGDPGTATVVVNDDDVAGVTVTQSEGNTVVAESGGTDSYTVVLTSEPAADVEITVTSDDTDISSVAPNGGAFAGSTVLTFTATTWNQAQTVRVQGVDDDIKNASDRTVVIGHEISAPDADSGYPAALDIADVTVTVTDDDTAGLDISAGSSVAVDEEGSSTYYTVALTSEPTAEVTVTITGASDPLTVDTGATLTFDDTNWSEVQTVTLTAADDDNMDEETLTLVHTASGSATEYGSVSENVMVSVIDNDLPEVIITGGEAGVTVTQSEGDTVVAESGGTDSYTVVLTSEPAANVEITVTSDDTDISRVAPNGGAFAGSTVLTFTATTWNQAQTVRVQGVDDDIKNASDRTVAIGHEISVPDVDGGYPAALDIADVTVTVTDDDTAGLDISETAVTVDEEGSSTYTVALTSEPTAEVTVTITGASAPLTVDTGATLTFDDTNWSDVQTVTLTAADDANMDEETLTLVHTASGSATEYGSVSRNVTVRVIDNDSTLPEVTIAGGAAVTEGSGDAAIFTLTASPAPSADLTVTVVVAEEAGQGQDFVDAGSEGTGRSVTISTSGTAEYTVAITDDDVDESNGTITVTIEAGSDYTVGDPGTATVVVNDDDTAGLDISEAAVTVDEEGSSTYTVALTSEPTADVTVTITGASDPLTVDTGTGATLTFDDTNWSDVQTVTLTAADDANMDDEPFTLVHTASGSATEYGSVSEDVTVSVNDSTLPEVTIAGGAAVTEGGGNAATFTLTAEPAPSADLTVTVAVAEEAGQDFVDAGSEGTGRSVTISTSGTAEYTVAITDNDVDESNGTITVTIEAGSDYTVGDPGAATVVVNDDDTAGLDISEAAVTVDEEGSSTYTVALTSEPTADVTVTITGASDPLTVDTGTGATLTFDDTNWSDVQTVTLTAADDANMDDEPFTLVHTASGSATEYGSVSGNVTVRVNDNDSTLPEVTIAGGAAVTEGSGDAVTFTLTAQPAPSAELTVTVAVAEEAGQDFVDAGTEGTGRSVTIGTSGTAEYTVAITDDDVDESNGTITVTIEAGSDYTVGDPGTATVVVNDDDVAGVTVTQSEGDTEVTESGGIDSYTVVLTSEPAANVEITVTSGDTDISRVAPNSGAFTASTVLTFTATTWNQAQMVRVQGVDDDVANTSDRTVTIGHAISVSDADSGYPADRDIADVTVTVTDDDKAGVMIAQSAGNTVVAELGGMDSYTVVLSSEPAGNIVISVTSGEVTAATVEPMVLTFTTATWNVAQTVTVTGVNDDIGNEGGQRIVTVSHAVTTDDAGSGYPADLSIDAVSVTVTDDDEANVMIVESAGNTVVAELGGTDSYTVVLNTEPTGDVVIDVTSGEVTAATVEPTALTFTMTTWNVAQTVTVTGEDDDIDNDDGRVVSISHAVRAGGSGGYDAVSIAEVSVSVEDDDEASLIFLPDVVRVDEASEQSYEVSLGTQPIGNVTVTISGSGGATGLTLDDDELTFTAGNWNEPQEVTVSAAPDDDMDSEVVTLMHRASADYGAPATGQVEVRVTDDDIVLPGVQVSPTQVTVDENGGVSDYDVVLRTRPLGDVEIELSVSGAASAADVEPLSLSFTSTNWDVAQAVQVTGVNDDIDSADRMLDIGHTIITNDGGSYTVALSIDSVSVRVEDDDEAGIAVDEEAVTVTENNGMATYDVRLLSQPVGNSTVVISVTSDRPTAATAAPSALMFTSANWSTAQQVTVTGEDDFVDNDGLRIANIGHSVSAGDGAGYTSSLSVGVLVTVTDNEMDAGLRISPEEITLIEGSSDTYTVELVTQPTAPVTVTIGGANNDLMVDAGDAPPTPNTLIFTSDNWNQAQTVTVTSVDDDTAAATRPVTLTHNADGDGYNGLMGAVTVSIIDNDRGAAVIISQQTDVTIAEGETNGYTVRLDAPPTANVQIQVLSSDPQVVSVESAILTFTPDNWATGQGVEITGVDDDIDNAGNQREAMIEHAVSADSGGYTTALEIDAIAVTVTDDDEAGLEFDPSRVTVVEGGSASYTVKLTSRPTAASVTVGIEPDSFVAEQGGSAIGVEPSELTFTSANWDTPQRVTLTAGRDGNSRDEEELPVRHSAMGGDYDFLTGVVTVDVADINRDAGVSIDRTGQFGITVTEGEVNDGYTIRLDAPPSGPVQIRMTSADPAVATVNPGVLTFTSDNWAISQRVTVTGVDDDIDSDDRTVMISHAASGGGYGGISVDPVRVSVLDNDEARLVFVPDTLFVLESSSGAYMVHLATRPTANVTISISGQANTDLTLSSDSLVFTSDNWDRPQAVTVAAGADDDSRHEMLRLTHTASGYAQPGVVTVNVADDENMTAGVNISPTTRLTVSEGGMVQYAMVLNAPPMSPVVITVTSDDEATAMTDSDFVTFTESNWGLPKVVTVTGVQDGSVIISHAIAERGADAATGYDISLAIPSVNVTVTSDEVQDSEMLMPQEMQEVEAAQESYVSGFGLTAIDHMLGGLNYRFSSPAQLGLSGNLGSLPGGGGHALNATVAGPGIDGFGYGGKGRGASDAFGAGSVDRLFSLSRSLSLPDILRGSHFIFRDEDGISIWGQASYSSYKDGNDGILTDGDVTTGMLGVDRDNGRTLLGLALAYSKGDGDWNGSNTDGDFSSTLASLLPYVRHDLTDRLQLWGAVSYGRGELEQTVELTGPSASGSPMPSEHDLDQLSASAGLRGTLMKRPAEEGGLTLTVTSDMSLARIEIEDSDEMSGMKLDTQRFRMGLEWSWQLPQADDGSRLVPDLELGLRYDGGDTSDGFGIELGGGISWELPSSGLTIDLRGRHLLEHENSDRREWGISGSLRYDLQPGSAQGPSFSLRHQYGNVPTSSGLDELLSDSLSDSLKEDTSEAGEVSGRWTLKGEWGFALDSGATGVPYAGLSSSRSNHDLSVGWRLLSAPERELSSELDIKAIRRQDDAGDAKHSIGAEFKLRW